MCRLRMKLFSAEITSEQGLRLVARLIRMLMVHAVDRNPLHWGALTAAGAQERQAVFQPSWADKSPVRQQAMIADIDAEHAEKIDADDSPSQSRPAK